MGNNKKIIHYILFLLTLGSTIYCGTKFCGGNIIGGILYSVTIMSILLVHEMGHYINAKKNGMEVTLPYFIPLPFWLGTMGAVIQIKSKIPNRNALIETGASGPLYGFIASVVAIVVGMLISPVSTQPVSGFLGTSLLYKSLAYLVKGVHPCYIVLNPVLFAGWLGLFVTMINLLPIGQLDGGHVIYALFGKSKLYATGMNYFFKAFIVAGFVCLFLFQSPTWLFFGVLVYFLHAGNVVHPPLTNEITDLTLWNKVKGWACIIIFILTFMPKP